MWIANKTKSVSIRGSDVQKIKEHIRGQYPFINVTVSQLNHLADELYGFTITNFPHRVLNV